MNILIENSIFELSPNPILIINNFGILLKSNRYSENILKFWNIIPGQNIPATFKNLIDNIKQGRKKEIELITENYIYSFKVVPHENDFILFGQDITSSYIINQKFKEIEDRYRLLANNSKDIISRHNLEGIFLYVSPACEPYLKKDPSHLLGKSLYSFIHSEDIAAVKQAFHEIKNTNKSLTIAFRILTHDHETVWLESVLKKVKSNYHSFYEVISVARDISDRKNMECALKASEELYKSVADNLSEGLITLDLSGNIQFVNGAMEKITEIKAENLIGKHISKITSSKHSEFIQTKLEDRKAGLTEQYEFFIETATGIEKWLEINSTPYKDISGNIIGALASLTDITQKKRQEEEIAKLSLVASKTDNGVVITNSKGLIEWVNESFTKISGYSLDEIKGKKPGTFLQGEGTDPYTIKTISENLAKEKSFETLLLNYTKLRKPYWVQIEITPVKDSSGSVVSYFSVQKDVTEKIQTLELLKESEQRYKDLLSASFEGIVVHKDGKVLDCNTRFSEMLGYPFDKIIGSPILKYIPEKKAENNISIDETLDKSLEHVAICCDGNKLPVEIVTKKHVYKNSIVKVSVIKDIGERIKTLIKLRESESKYRDLVETASSFIYTSDYKGNFQYVNSVGIRKMGYTQEEFLSMNFRDPVIPSWKDRVENFYNNQFQNKIRESYFEFPVYTKNKEILWIGQNVQMIEENGWISGFNCYARDITERKVVEHELDSQKDLLKIILDTLPIGIFLNNNLGELLFINNEASKKYGNNVALFENKSGDFSSHTELQNVNDNDHFITEEKVAVASGEKHILIGKKKIFSDYFNNPLSLGYFIDITDRKSAEEALISAKQKAEESTQAKERFISIMSHEIRTPMNAVVGITNLLIQQSHSEEQKEYLHALKTSSDNLLKILNNILDLSKLESGKISFENIAFDIREILSEIQETFKFKAAEKNIEIINIVASDIPRLLNGDPLRLHQILVNLVSNALKFTLEGKITVKIEILNQNNQQLHLLFSVSDTGIGIPREKFIDIFESFTQVSTEVTRKFGGTGLGLTITKRLVELQGGTINVESTLDKGSRFFFDLWLDKSNSLVESNDWDLQYDLKGIKLLLVEDNEMNRLVVKKYLEKEHIEITLAEDGKKAIELFEAKNFDLILMDLQMPVMDGYEAAKYIRNTNSQIPIIAFTASSSTDIEYKVKGVGMTDIITKPFQPSKLCGLIAKYTSKEQLLKNRNATTMQSLNPIQTMDYKFINLTYLREASNGNIPFIQNMIEIFLKQTPGYLEELQFTLEQNDWEKFRKTIHKMKPTIPMMGIPLQKEVAEIEESAKQQTNLDKVPMLLEKLVTACHGSYKELQLELEKIKRKKE